MMPKRINKKNLDKLKPKQPTKLELIAALLLAAEKLQEVAPDDEITEYICHIIDRCTDIW